MLFKKIYFAITFFFALQMASQNTQIKIPDAAAGIKEIEAIASQEIFFEKDTIALLKYLEPLKDKDITVRNSNWMIQKLKFEQKINSLEMQLKNESKMKKIYVIICGLVILLAFFLYYNLRRQLKNRQYEHQQKKLVMEFEKVKTEKKLLEANRNLNIQIDYLKDKNIQIGNLKKQIALLEDSPPSTDNRKQTGKLYALLESHLMTEENWTIFKREFQKEHTEFYQLLENQFPEITDSNKRTLLLQKLNFNNNEIAALLGVTSEAVKKSKQRLKKKLGMKYNLLNIKPGVEAKV